MERQNALQVRYVFEGQDAPGSAASKRQLKAAASDDASANDSLFAIKRVLRNVTVHERSVITNWCSRNATQMQVALESVATMQADADVMSSELSTSHATLKVLFLPPL